MKIPHNKFTLLALIWFAAALYALLRESAGGSPPPFPHFDKLAHFLIFFAQIWLLAKVFMQEKRPIPYRGLLLFGLLFAAGSETAQALFTQTREGSWLDGLADMLGTGAALWLAQRVGAAKQAQSERNHAA